MDAPSATTGWQSVSVIVPAFNAAETIEACVRALMAQTFDQPYEIIVVDDGSDDATAALAKALGARVLSTPRRRPAAARNAGIAAATGRIICCTDADCEPTPDWLAQLTRPLADSQVVASKGTYATRQRSIVARFVQLEYEDKYDLMAGAETIDFIDTYSAAYRREALLACGGFDGRFLYLEDQELSFRLAAAGQKMVYVPDAVVYHHHADSLWAYTRKKATIGYWKAQVVRRFPQRAVRDSHTPQVMKLQMLLTAMLLTALVALAVAMAAGWPAGVWATSSVAGVAALAFLASTLSFCVKAWPKDRPIALLAPLLLFVRALALAAGTAHGLIAPPQGLEEPRPANAAVDAGES